MPSIVEMFGSRLAVRSSSSSSSSNRRNAGAGTATSDNHHQQKSKGKPRKLEQSKIPFLITNAGKENQESSLPPMKRQRVNSTDSQDTSIAMDEEGGQTDADATTTKKKSSKKPSLLPPFEVLLTDIMTRIFLYLDDSKDLLSLSLCGSTRIRDAITTQVVVRTAVFAGGISKARMDHVRKLVLDKSIHIPSTFRLLRLINGKLCERGSACYGYNRTTEKAAVVDNHQTYTTQGISFGLHVCKRCADTLAMPEQATGTTSFAILRDSTARILVRSRQYHPSNCQLIVAQQFEAASGDPIGPVYDSRMHHQLCATHEGRHNLTREHIFEATADVCESVEYVDQRKEILVAYDDANADYPKVAKAKRDLTEAKELRDKLDREQREREENLKKQYKILRRLELALSDCKHKDLMLQHKIKNGKIEFLGPSKIHLSRMMEQPYAISNDLSQHFYVDRAKQLYSLLDKHGFLYGSSTYLQPFKMKSKDLPEKLLFKFCVEDLGFFAAIQSQHMRLYDTAMHFLALEQPFIFVIANLSDGQLHDIFDDFVDGIESDEWPEEFSGYPLAKFFWSEKIKKALDAEQSAVCRAELFKKAVNSIVGLYENYADYLDNYAVKAWDPDYDDKNELLEISNIGELDLLMDREFGNLLAVHRANYEEHVAAV